MKIKKYNQFIKENVSEKSVGEWIESVAKDDDYLMNIISQYTQDIDPTVRLANAINVLNKSQQEELEKKVRDYIDGVDQPQDVEVSANVDSGELMESVQVAGKNIFKSFLKVITALGLKEHTPDWNKTPDSFLIYFLFENVDVAKLKMVLNRFKSLASYSESIDYTQNLCHLYFGIKTDMTFEYGFKTDVESPVGKFSLNKSNFNWILLLDSPSAAPLKRQMIDLDINKILLFSKIKIEMSKWNPGYSEKKSIPQITNDVMTFGYYGVGKWDNGKLDVGEFENIKNNFKIWLSKFKWSEKILVSVTNNSFWVYFNFKLK
jgi:hypothetical protein